MYRLHLILCVQVLWDKLDRSRIDLYSLHFRHYRFVRLKWRMAYEYLSELQFTVNKKFNENYNSQ